MRDGDVEFDAIKALSMDERHKRFRAAINSGLLSFAATPDFEVPEWFHDLNTYGGTALRELSELEAATSKLVVVSSHHSPDAQYAATILNEALALDCETISRMCDPVVCNQALTDHPTIEAAQYEGESEPSTGLVGILNGIFRDPENVKPGPIYYIRDIGTGIIGRFGIVDDEYMKRMTKPKEAP